MLFNHHDAQEDARAAGEILVRAIVDSNRPLESWMEFIAKRDWTRYDFARQGNPDGPLAGEVVVFTGSLMLARKEAAELAARMGCEVAAGVTAKTTLLVVGDQDIRLLAGKDKSSKHRKAEELIAKGQTIRVLGESDFARLIEAV